MDNVSSSILTFNKLTELNLSIPDYQRPYVWELKQVKKLIESINKDKKLLGSIVLYKNNDTYEIIDGQQRLTTIKLILKALDKNNKFLENAKYYHQISHIKIKQNYEYIQKYLKQNNNFYDKLQNTNFICISTNDIKRAFVFFDNINTKGKKLENYDLIKAYWVLNTNNDLINYYVKKYNDFIEDGKKHKHPTYNGVIYSNYFQYFLKNIAIIRGYMREYNKNYQDINIIDEYCKITPFSAGLNTNNINASFTNGVSFFAWAKKHYENTKLIAKSDFISKFQKLYVNNNLYHYTIFVLIVYLDKFVDGDFNKIARMIVRITYYRAINNDTKYSYQSLIQDCKYIIQIILSSNIEEELVYRLNELITHYPYKQCIKQLEFLEQEFKNYGILGASYE